MRTLLVASLLALLAAACDGDDRAVTVHGRLLLADGSPAAGYRVTVLSSWALFPYDAASQDVYTDAEGRYALSGHLRDGATEAERIDVGFLDDLDGQLRLELSIPAEPGEHTLPDKRLWDDGLALTPVPEGGVRATWSRAPEGAPAGYQLEMYQDGPEASSGSALPSWRAYAVPLGPYDIPADLVEDRFARLQLWVGDDDPGFFCVKELCVRWYSASIEMSQGELIPSSRGASCTADVGSGSEVPLLGRAGAPCTLTDGYVAYGSLVPDDWICGGSRCNELYAVTIDLGGVVPVQTIVVRSLYLESDDAAFVETSRDGIGFERVATVDQSLGIIYERVHLDAPTSARFIRVVPAGAGTIGALAELSAF